MDNTGDLEEAIFTNARHIAETAERERYIRDACGADAQLAHRIQSLLLRVHAEETLFLESPVAMTTAIDLAYDTAETVGSMIGPYKLIEQIGAGGMGLVFLAQQYSPIRRRVALKIIRPGMDTREGIRRFEAERQTLAQLNHPGVTRLLDAGTTITGRPWFVMELAQGLPITDFCQMKSLSISERLRLFESVCHAVEHAHQHGVIHRDIKPANVLVIVDNARHLPKVIDFGVARIAPDQNTGDSDGAISGASEPKSIVGTPAYMSPEQTYLPDRQLDARCDVYSMGMLLYRLLTDADPFHGIQWQHIDYAETRRVIHELLPPVPSECIRSLSRAGKPKFTSTVPPRSNNVGNRDKSPTQLPRSSSLLKGDLDWITMKAIEKNRERRYASVGALAADIARYFRDEPVDAAPPSRMYRFKKLVRRRTARLAILLLSLGLLLLVSLSTLISRSLHVERVESAKIRQLVLDSWETVVERDDIIRDQRYATEIRTGIAKYFHGDVQRARETVRQFSVGADSPPIVGFAWNYLNRLCSDSPKILTGDEGKVFSVAFSPDGSLLASCAWGDAGSLQIRDTANGAVVRSIRGFDNDLNATCFNTDGTIVLTAEDAGRIRVWEAQTGDLKAQLEGFDHSVSQIFLASDDSTLVASEVDWASLKSKTSIWDLKSLTRIKLIDQQRMLDVNELRKTVATVSNDGDISLLSFPDLDVMTTFSERQIAVDCGCLSHDGNTLVTGSKLGAVQIWRRDSGHSVQLSAPPPNAPAIRDVEFSLDDQQLLVVQSDGVAQIWNIAARDLYRVFHTDTGDAWSVDVSPDGKTFAIGYNHGRVELRDFAGHSSLVTTVHRSSEPFRAVAHDTEGGRMAIVNSVAKNVDVHSTIDGKILQTIPAPSGVQFRNVEFSADDQSLWITDENGSLFNYNLTTAELADWQILDRPLQAPILSADGRFLALNSIDTENSVAGVWEVPSGTQIFRLSASPESGNYSHWITGFPDDSTILSQSAGSVIQWNLKTGQEVLPRFEPQSGWIFHSRLSPDRKSLLVALGNADVHVLDLASRKTATVLLGHKNVPKSSAFSLNGRTLATAAGGSEIRLWHPSTGQTICELPGIRGEILSLWFTADETRLFAAVQLESGDSQIIVWDTTKP